MEDITAAMPRLTLRRLPDGKSVQVIAENVTEPRRMASRMYLRALVKDIRVLSNDFDDQNVVAVVGPPMIMSGFELGEELSNEIIKAVLSAHDHEPGFYAKIVDEVNDRVFYARVLKSERSFYGDKMLTASTPEELQQRFERYPYLEHKFHSPDPEPSPRPKLSFDDDLYEAFGRMFGGEPFNPEVDPQAHPETDAQD